MSSAEYSCRLFKPIFTYRQTVWTLIRLLLKEQSDLGPHCLPVCKNRSEKSLGPHCLQKLLLKSQADDKADDNTVHYCIHTLIIGYFKVLKSEKNDANIFEFIVCLYEINMFGVLM